MYNESLICYGTSLFFSLCLFQGTPTDSYISSTSFSQTQSLMESRKWKLKNMDQYCLLTTSCPLYFDHVNSFPRSKKFKLFYLFSPLFSTSKLMILFQLFFGSCSKCMWLKKIEQRIFYLENFFHLFRPLCYQETKAVTKSKILVTQICV